GYLRAPKTCRVAARAREPGYYENNFPRLSLRKIENRYRLRIVPSRPIPADQTAPTIAPPTAEMTTTSQGGVRHMKSNKNAMIPNAKSPVLVIPDVHTG